jgi:hypothetical protein
VCIHRYTVAHLPIHCCHVTGTVPSRFIVVFVAVAIDYIKVFSVAADMKVCVYFSLLASYKIFRNVVNNNMMSGCIVALVMRHANRIFSAPYYIATCRLSASTVFFLTLSHKWHDCPKKTVLNVKCLF